MVRSFWRKVAPLLEPACRVYGAVAVQRREGLERAARRLTRPVISVGNITCGGTGKTPTVEMIARDLVERGRRPALLSRGYGNRYRRAVSVDRLAQVMAGGGDAPRPVAGNYGNDEFHVLAANLPSVQHYQGRDRFACGERAITGGADVLVLDDGFQHAGVARDLDIVLVDAITPFGNGRVLPAGLLREPIDVLDRADLFGITRSDLVDSAQLSTLSSYLRSRFGATPQVLLRTRPDAWWSLDGERTEARSMSGRRVLAFCGIGNPWAFQRQLRLLGVRVDDIICFRDHHRYTLQDVDRVLSAARRSGVDEVVMTQKDAVKLEATETTRDWKFLRIEQELVRGEAEYHQALDAVLSEP